MRKGATVDHAIDAFYDTLFDNGEGAPDAPVPRPDRDQFMETLVRGAASKVDSIDARIKASLGAFQHGITNTSYTVTVLTAEIRRKPSRFEWVNLDELARRRVDGCLVTDQATDRRAIELDRSDIGEIPAGRRLAVGERDDGGHEGRAGHRLQHHPRRQ